jgi:hypothetical protein
MPVLIVLFKFRMHRSPRFVWEFSSVRPDVTPVQRDVFDLKESQDHPVLEMLFGCVTDN